MQRWITLAVIALTLSACASGRQTTGTAPADASSSKLSVDLQVASEPSGAQVEVLEPDDPPGKTYLKTGKRGVTPCQFTLEQNQPMQYCLEFTKEGYKTEKQDIYLYQGEGEGGKKVGHVIGKAGDLLIAPPLWILGWAIKKIPGGKYLEANPNPVTVTLVSGAALPPTSPTPPASVAKAVQPDSPVKAAGSAGGGKSQNIQAMEFSCLFKSLSLSPSPAQENPGASAPIVARAVPLRIYVKLKDTSREFSCQALREELEKGGKLAFFKGVLEMGNQVYHFQDGAFIVAQGPGKFLGCGITCQPLARAEVSEKVEASPKGRNARQPADEDEEDY